MLVKEDIRRQDLGYVVSGTQRGTGARPPFANRGVDTKQIPSKCTLICPKTLTNETIDYLTLTTSEAVSEHLLGRSKLYEKGVPMRGFGATEQRECLGGRLWRRYEAIGNSTKYGKDYESWEWDGPIADSAVRYDVPMEGCYPSRMDIAYDFDVPADFMADDALEQIIRHVRGAGLKTGISGQDGINTLYVGGRQSEKRLRIYRKDLHPKNRSMYLLDPTVRMEIILKADTAKAIWSLKNYEHMIQAGRTVLEGLSGVELHDCRALPVMPPEPAVELYQRLFYFAKQHCVVIGLLAAYGIEIDDLVVISNETMSKATRARLDRDLKKHCDVSSEDILDALRTAAELDNAWE